MSQYHQPISEELLARYLANTATEDEKAQIENWLAASEENRQEFRGYQLIWSHSANKQKEIAINTDAAWNKLKTQLNAKPAKPAQPKEIIFTPERKKRTFPVPLAAAVSFLLIALAFYIFRSKTPAQVEVATNNETQEQLLPDGTKVTLNYHSALSYPQKFEGEMREVTLQGEAFFEVKPDAAHPFIIKANEAEVKVLGTSFNVNAYKNNRLRVDVASGKVQVSKADKRIQLGKGEGAEVSADTIIGSKADMNALGYQTQIYDFNAATLQQVIETIGKGYHAEIKLSNAKIAQCKLTIHFEKQPLNAVLSVISETLGLSLRKEGNVYWLDGNSCQ